MACTLQYLFLILFFVVPMHKCIMVIQDGRCIKMEPCFDLRMVENIANNVSKDMISADGEKILLKHNSFDKIREKKILHSCVLLKIIDLFENVLEKTIKTVVHDEQNNHEELIHIMVQLRNCVYKVNCAKLYRSSDLQYENSDKNATSLPEILEKCKKPKEFAVFQLRKLKYASERLSDVHIQEMLMDELKTFHLYMQGKAFISQTYN